METDRGATTETSQSQRHRDQMANKPWGMWTAAGREKKDMQVAQGNLSATMDDSRRHMVNEHTKVKEKEDFWRKAWMQRDKSSSAWVMACPKEHSYLNSDQFPVVCQTYFGVPQTCLEGLKGQPILQKSRRRGRRNRETECNVYGENLVKATLPGGGWIYHHNGINLQLHMIFRQSGMTIDMEVEDYFLRKLREMAINPAQFVPLLSRNLKGHVPDGHQTGMASGKYPAGVNQFI